MLEFEFMQNAFLATLIVGVLSGFTGYFLVVRGQSFAGHALSHVGFTGATGAALLGVSPLYGLMAFTIMTGIAMGLLGERMENRDIAVGLVLSLALGFGVMFLHLYTGYAARVTALLFGNILGVDRGTLHVLVGFGVVCLIFLVFLSRPLLFASLQPEIAQARGVSLRVVGVLFLASVAVATAECVQITGVLLVFVLMVGPAAAAHCLCLAPMGAIVLSVILAVAEGWGGIVLSWVTDLPVTFWISVLGGCVYGVFHIAGKSCSCRGAKYARLDRGSRNGAQPS